jgi:membrane protein
MPESPNAIEADGLRNVPTATRRLTASELAAVCRESLVQWRADNAQRLGASVAFYTMLSLAPLLVVTVAVAAAAFGEEAARGQLFWEIRRWVGGEEATAIQSLIQNAYRPSTGVLATVLSVATLALGATTVVVELRDALNTIWKVSHPTQRSRFVSMLSMFKERLYAFGLVLGMGLLLLLSLVLNTCRSALDGAIGSLPLTLESLPPRVIYFLASYIVVTALFAAVYKILPDVRLRWSDVIAGASITGLLFIIGKELIGLYLGKVGFSSTYGAAGSLAVVLAWVYYSAQLFFFGAEVTKVYVQTFGSELGTGLR